MASVTVTIPDSLVDDMTLALAAEMRVAPPTTGAAKLQLAQDFMKREAKEALLNYRVQVAAQSTRTNPNDLAVTW